MWPAWPAGGIAAEGASGVVGPWPACGPASGCIGAWPPCPPAMMAARAARAATVLLLRFIVVISVPEKESMLLRRKDRRTQSCNGCGSARLAGRDRWGGRTREVRNQTGQRPPERRARCQQAPVQPRRRQSSGKHDGKTCCSTGRFGTESPAGPPGLSRSCPPRGRRNARILAPGATPCTGEVPPRGRGRGRKAARERRSAEPWIHVGPARPG